MSHHPRLSGWGPLLLDLYFLLFLLRRLGWLVIVQNFRDLIVIIMRALVIPFGSLRSWVHGYGRHLVFPWPIRQCRWKSMSELSAGTALLAGGPVGDCGLVFRLDTSPCFLLPVPHVIEQMGRLYFGNVKFLFGMAFPRFWSSFDGSAGFWRIGIRRIPVIGKIDSRYVWWEQGPFGTDERDSIRKAGGTHSLSDILLAGGQ